jgi:hypothetical protein
MDLALAGAFVVIAAKLRLEPSRSFNPRLLVVVFSLMVLVQRPCTPLPRSSWVTGCWR